MIRISLELPYLQGLFVDITEQPATRFAVEARRRDDHVVLLFTPLTALGLVLSPVVPLVRWRIVGKLSWADDRRKNIADLFMEIRYEVEFLGDRFNEFRFVSSHTSGSN